MERMLAPTIEKQAQTTSHISDIHLALTKAVEKGDIEVDLASQMLELSELIESQVANVTTASVLDFDFDSQLDQVA